MNNQLAQCDYLPTKRATSPRDAFVPRQGLRAVHSCQHASDPDTLAHLALDKARKEAGASRAASGCEFLIRLDLQAADLSMC